MEKTFDAVAWMRKRREDIEKEDAGLSWQEAMTKTTHLLKEDPLWKRLQNRVIRQSVIMSSRTSQ